MTAVASNLTISVCTIGPRIFKALELIQNGPKDVCYLIIHQKSEGIKDDIDTKIQYLIKNRQINVKYYAVNTIGVTYARNSAIEFTNTEYMLFTDDDVALTEGILDALNKISISNCDVATFICLNEKNESRRNYSSTSFTHNRISLFGIGTVEIMIKVKKVRELLCKFPTNMGAGQYLSVADEPVFLSRCLNEGCKIKFFPIPIVSHQQDSSGGLLKTNGSLMARGVAVKEIFGNILGLFLLLVFVIKSRGQFSRYKNIKGFLHSFYYMYYGFFKCSAK